MRTQVSPWSPCQEAHFHGKRNCLAKDWFLILSWQKCPTVTGSVALDPQVDPMTNTHSLLGGTLPASSAGSKYHLYPYLSGIPSLYLHPLAMLSVPKARSVSGASYDLHYVHSKIHPVLNPMYEVIPEHTWDSYIRWDWASWTVLPITPRSRLLMWHTVFPSSVLRLWSTDHGPTASVFSRENVQCKKLISLFALFFLKAFLFLNATSILSLISYFIALRLIGKKSTPHLCRSLLTVRTAGLWTTLSTTQSFS